MRLNFPVRPFSDIPKEIAQEFAGAATKTMDAVKVGLVRDLRAGVQAAGLGSGVANAWRGTRYPLTGKSISAAVFVVSNAPAIIEAFSQGATIVPVNGTKYLAIPAPDAGVLRASGRGHKRLTPALWEQETGAKLRFVPRGDHGLLVSDFSYRRQAVRYQRRASFKPIKNSGEKRTQVIFILVKAVKMKKLLDPEATAKRWADATPGLLDQNIG